MSAGIFKQSMGARNRVGIGLSYWPARLHSLVELVSLESILGLLKSLKIRAQEVVERTNTEVSSQTGGAVAEFMRVEDLADIAYQPSLCVSNSNFFKVIGNTMDRYLIPPPPPPPRVYLQLRCNSRKERSGQDPHLTFARCPKAR
jgi:hypothetical protein